MTLLFALLSLTTLPAQHLPGDPPDPWYSFGAWEKQEQPVTRRISQLVSPTMGAPALVTSGGKFAMWSVRPPRKVTFTPSGGCGAAAMGQITQTTKKPGRAGQVPLYRTVVRVPTVLPRGSYGISVVWDDGTLTREPNAMRSLGSTAKGDLKILFYSDHQLRDPSWKVLNGQKSPDSFPKHGASQRNIAMTLQQFQEIELRDPDIVIHLGDLLFGLEFPEEYQNALDTWGNARFATWFIPGNHDGYATYSLRLPSWQKLGLGIITCRSKFPSSFKDYLSVFTYISCLYSDIKEELFSNLVADGLVYWRQMWGPTRYAFTRGAFRFIFLNTYSGTNKRRHSFSIFLKIKNLFLGAPGVDNYGGYLSDEELRWAERELKQARRAGLTPIVLGHHDPRGNLDQTPYHENEPFPTSPIGIGHFEEWNYDGSWDSDTTDQRTKESATSNSGVRLLKLLATHGGYYFSGHVHKDGQWTFDKGQVIAHGVKAARPLTFVKVTTAASSRKDNGYWGYRVVTAQKDGTVDLHPFGKGMLSVPGGNLWVSSTIDLDMGTVAVTSSLPAPTPITIPLCLPANKEGYTLKTAKGVELTLQHAPSNADDTKERYLFSFTPNADSSPFTSPLTQKLAIAPARGNRAPQIVITADGKRISAHEGATYPAVLSAKLTKDPEGNPLAQAHWVLNDEIFHGLTLSLKRPGRTPVTVLFKVRDSRGAWAQQRITLTPSVAQKKIGPHGCGCRYIVVGTTGAGLLVLLLIFAWFVFIRRRRLSRGGNQG